MQEACGGAPLLFRGAWVCVRGLYLLGWQPLHLGTVAAVQHCLLGSKASPGLGSMSCCVTAGLPTLLRPSMPIPIQKKLELCSRPPAVDSGATQSEPSQKRRKKGAGGAAAACGAGGPPLTAAMLQRARPALRALLGAPQPEATSLGAGGTGSSIAHQQAGDGKRKSSSSGSGESWVSGERLAQLAARLGVGEPTLRDIAEALLAPDRDVRGQAGLASLQVGAVGGWACVHVSLCLGVGERRGRGGLKVLINGGRWG